MGCYFFDGDGDLFDIGGGCWCGIVLDVGWFFDIVDIFFDFVGGVVYLWGGVGYVLNGGLEWGNDVVDVVDYVVELIIVRVVNVLV